MRLDDSWLFESSCLLLSSAELLHESLRFPLQTPAQFPSDSTNEQLLQFGLATFYKLIQVHTSVGEGLEWTPFLDLIVNHCALCDERSSRIILDYGLQMNGYLIGNVK